ncbi:MAG TPA: hypothetical protein VMF29_00855 [Candidatus Edwardsbacteria bacterium]|nr:hypothetical protein [Candidatus Edwardsbacteria bacterium]
MAELLAVPRPDSAQTDVAIHWSNHNYNFRKNISSSGMFFIFNQAYRNIVPDSSLNFGRDEVTITVISNFGTSTGHIKVPDSLVCIAPAENAIYHIGDTIHYCWRTCENADYYSISLYITLFDSSFSAQYKNMYFTSLDTQLLVAPDNYMMNGMTYCLVTAMITPNAGPMPEQHSPSNMTGDIKGYLMAEGQSAWRNCQVGQP